MLLPIGQLVIGLVLLYLGGEYLVRGATRIALLARLSTAVIGLTVVAMGTSLPELAVSMDAAARGATDLAYGNIIGSNIFNVGAILGLSAVLGTIKATRQTVRTEYPFMLAAAVVVVLLGFNRIISRVEGILFLLALFAFMAYVLYLSRRELAKNEELSISREVKRAAHTKRGSGRAWGINLLLVAIGIVGLVGGADQVVQGAVEIALKLGVDGRVVGLTVVAMGTSLPELAASIVAARQGENDIALANIVGSNIFNLLAILGATAAVFPVPIHPRAVVLDNWVMLAFCAALFPPMYFTRRVSRRDGLILMAAFVAYMTFVVVTELS